MDVPEKAEFDEDEVTEESRIFAALLFARLPGFRRYAAMEQIRDDEAWTLVVNVPAASGDRRAKLVIWLNNGYEPSVGFGGWHTHGGFWGDTEDIARSALIDLIEDILAERYVLCEDIGGKEDGWAELLDMSEEDVLLERLTRPKTPGRVRLRSWTGQLDREVSLEDLERGTFA